MTVRVRLVGLALALTTLLLYLPAGRHGFVLYDDPDYLTENRIVQAGLSWQGLEWAATTWHAYNWHPVTWISHMLDCQLFGLDPGAHHLVNAAWHAANAFLLLALLSRLTGAFWPSAWAAALFAWHPLHVESVAWASERKDVLSAFFFLLTLLVWHNYASQTPASFGARLRRGWYWTALALFALGLMAKPMLVTLPFVLLLLDYWPYRRLAPGNSAAATGGSNPDWRARLEIPCGRRVPPQSDTGETSVPRLSRRALTPAFEKWPFLVLSAASCVVTFLAQRTQAVVGLEPYPLQMRFGNALLAYAGYLRKMIWPSDLAIIYPLPLRIPWAKAALAAAFLAVVTGCAWRWRRERPYWLVGWCWYLGMLVPVIGLVQVGGQAMADRYTYLPLVGVLLVLALEAGRWADRLRLPPAVRWLAAGLTLAGCLGATAHLLPVWRDSESLFTHALAMTRNNAIAHVDLGVAFEAQGRTNAAMREYETALSLSPSLTQVHNNLANLLDAAGRPEEALTHYREAVRLRPGAFLPQLNLASLLARMGRFDEARRQYAVAARLSPDDPRPHLLLGKALLRQGHSAEAVEAFREALLRDPNHILTLATLARVLASDPDPRARSGDQAVALARQALALAGGKPAFLLDTLAMAYAEAGRFDEAAVSAREALAQAQAGGESSDADAVRQRLACYQAHRPWREDPREPDAKAAKQNR